MHFAGTGNEIRFFLLFNSDARLIKFLIELSFVTFCRRKNAS
jgi:hypothetical protein